MHLTPWHVVGLLATIVLIIGVGIYSGRKVRSAADFASGGGKAGAWIVCGAIMGTLVSGQATIGTAQLAFNYGMSAWWFTLGSGIGCLILALGYAAPLRHSGCSTLLQIVSREYGPRAETWGSVLSSIGIFISVVAQILSATALLITIFPVSHLAAALISILLMAVYVMFGGVWGAGMGGVVKLILLYVSAIAGGVLVYGLANGFGGVLETVEHLLVNSPLGALSGVESQQAVHERFTSLIARGASKDIGSGLSLVLGVLSTQTYAQAIWSGKSDRAAKKGALLSACLIPPIGIACILIGLYMRGHCITADEVAALQAVGQSVPEGLIQIESTFPGLSGVCGPVYARPLRRGGAGDLVHHCGGGWLRPGFGDGLHPGDGHLLPKECPGQGGLPHQPPGDPRHHPGHPIGGCRGGHPGAWSYDQRLRLPLHGPAGSGGLPAPVWGPVAQGKDPPGLYPYGNPGRAHCRSGRELYEPALRLPLPGHGSLPGDYGRRPGCGEAYPRYPVYTLTCNRCRPR